MGRVGGATPLPQLGQSPRHRTTERRGAAPSAGSLGMRQSEAHLPLSPTSEIRLLKREQKSSGFQP